MALVTTVEGSKKAIKTKTVKARTWSALVVTVVSLSMPDDTVPQQTHPLVPGNQLRAGSCGRWACYV